jgi:hypothetical protein
MNSEDWKNALPEEINLWRRTSNLIAWNTIERQFYQGVIAGSEYLVYNAGKLYIGLEVQFSCTVAEAAAFYVVDFFDMANALNYQATNTIGYYNGAAVRYVNNSLVVKNIYFSRVDPAPAVYMIFNGYKLVV